MSIPDPFIMATTTANDVLLAGYATTMQGRTGASSTVELVRLDVTVGATTTFQVICGAAATPAATPTWEIIRTNVYTQGTGIATSSTGIIENNTATTTGYIENSPGTRTTKIQLGPSYPYLTCVVNTVTAYAGGFTGANNTFAGKATVRISRQR